MCSGAFKGGHLFTAHQNVEQNNFTKTVAFSKCNNAESFADWYCNWKSCINQKNQDKIKPIAIGRHIDKQEQKFRRIFLPYSWSS